MLGLAGVAALSNARRAHDAGSRHTDPSHHRETGGGRVMPVTKRRRLSHILLSTVAFFAYQMDAARAHTVSIGYAFAGPGAVNLWYGSYHADATFNKASLQLVGPSVNSTRDFILLSATKPVGL